MWECSEFSLQTTQLPHRQPELLSAPSRAGSDQVPHRHTGNSVAGQRPLVVSQQVGGRATHSPQRVVDAGQHRAQALVPGRQCARYRLQASQAQNR